MKQANTSNRILILLLIVAFCTIGFGGYSQVKSTAKPTRVLFILDASGSMNGKWKTESKLDMAKQILLHLADSFQRENIPYGLRVFGHLKDRSLEDCRDTKLELSIANNNRQKLQLTLDKINAKGYSPIALSLEDAIKDFPLSKSEQRSVIILISDGFENCSGDACLASSKLQNAGIYLKPYIVGLGLSPEHKKNFECVGQIFDIKAETDVNQAQIASVVISSVMNPTSLQINLLNTNDKPTESNVNMSFFDEQTSAIKYNIYHTLSTSGLPDTLFLDPNNRYRLKVHTIPPVALNSIDLIQGKHTIKAIEAAQGQLKINLPGTMKVKGIKCIVRKNGQIVNVQDVNTLCSYLVGEYDIEVLTTPIVRFNNVQILQSQTKTLNLLGLGSITINKPAGYLYIMKRNDKNELEKIYTVDVNVTKEVVALMPGSYEFIYRAKASITSKASVSKKVSIVSGLSSSITF